MHVGWQLFDSVIECLKKGQHGSRSTRWPFKSMMLYVTSNLNVLILTKIKHCETTDANPKVQYFIYHKTTFFSFFLFSFFFFFFGGGGGGVGVEGVWTERERDYVNS